VSRSGRERIGVHSWLERCCQIWRPYFGAGAGWPAGVRKTALLPRFERGRDGREPERNKRVKCSPARRDACEIRVSCAKICRGRHHRETPAEDLIQVTLAGVKRGGDGALVLNTTEGAVWRQIEAAALHPEPVAGDTLTIKHTVFGGYMCQSKKWIVFRCVRTR
jgi:hypothetical protein